MMAFIVALAFVSAAVSDTLTLATGSPGRIALETGGAFTVTLPNGSQG